MAALAGYKASAYVSTGVSTAMTNEAMTDVGGLHTTYSITNQAHRYIDPSVPVVVQTSPDGSTWTTVTVGYTLQPVIGTVVFAVAVTGGTPSCRLLSASWLTVSQAIQAKSIDVTPSQNIMDISTFATGAWKVKLVGIGEATIKLSQWWVDNFYLNALGTLMVVTAYSGANANQRLECYAYMKTDGIKLDIANPVEESIDFESHGAMYAVLS